MEINYRHSHLETGQGPIACVKLPPYSSHKLSYAFLRRMICLTPSSVSLEKGGQQPTTWFKSWSRNVMHFYISNFLSVFLDIEIAYDTMWRFEILRDLSAIRIHGNVLSVIESYLSNRTFHVKIGTTLSRLFTHQTGVPQGGDLSWTLFIIKMNSLRTTLPPAIFYSIDVDDVQIGFKSCNLTTCERRIQLSLNKVSNCAD